MTPRLPITIASLLLTLLALASCSTQPYTTSCPEGGVAAGLPQCPPMGAVADVEIDEQYALRNFYHPQKGEQDLIELSKQVDLPRLPARGKILGTSAEAALDSLAAKLWMIEHAEHTIDMMYYIYKNDLIGLGLMGALCDAVVRGVDVRFMVDSIGSISLPRSSLRALATCAEEAGFMRNAAGELTTRRARLQVVVFNPLSKLLANANRRSHDKLIIVDGMFPDKAALITGGRNISVDYYGVDKNGAPNADTYRDTEILLRDGAVQGEGELGLGELTEHYFTVLFLFKDNAYQKPLKTEQARSIYRRERATAQASLARLKALPAMQQHMAHMPTFMTTGLAEAKVLLAHELANLTDSKPVSNATGNISNNPNSIVYVLQQIGEIKPQREQVRYVSPYLFLARYEGKGGEVLLDEAENTLAWLNANPGATLEIVTNSILTSDNFSAQSIIDMETAPRLLLDEETRAAWLAAKESGSDLPELVTSQRWLEQVNNPRIRIYQTGGIDSVLLPGGTVHYGKMHAKYVVGTSLAFVGTSNFDYRSRLFNNEMGYFFQSPQLIDALNVEFDDLKATSYLWGTPEWFAMRQQVMQLSGVKGSSSRKQRGIYRMLKSLGLDWLF
ncbi:phospholipase [Halieaceae bacterium IMCC14734]|uniref:Phospholipase n=1 Tax=Candidatus Litorirhabdus singularis TaxID=2518993 RepID=A0ABT3TN63_9GAMM|nr:phospholipase D-like domain-containing protein [Candidatus Litorirhabdus singularis]MCX2982814.1 phospholipase [Candidatus Litorirhabdus singularis]